MAQKTIQVSDDDPVRRLSYLAGGVLGDALRGKPKVGKVGGTDALVFEGQKTFSAEEIRRALGKDFDFVLASDPHADLENYLKILDRRLSEGFRKVGFPDIKIAATALPESGQVRITIEEGQRCKNGDLVIECPDAVDRQVMKRYLTEGEAYETPTPPTLAEDAKQKGEKSQPKLWKAGEMTDFLEKPEKLYADAIKAGLKAQGYFYSEFEVAIKPDGKGLADLCVKVTDPGPKATIGTIAVEGLKHHTKEQIVEHLGIKPGMPVNHIQKAAWEEKLNESRCFLESDVIVLPAIGPGAPSELLLRVVEQPEGPFLEEELTRRDQIMVKAADWISSWHDGGQGDLVMVIQDESNVPLRLMMIASPKQGMAIDAEFQVPDPVGRLHYTIAVTPKKVRISSWHHGRQVEFGLGDVSFTPMIALRHIEKKDDPGNWETGLSLSWGINNKNPGQPFRFKFQVDPEVAVALVRHPKETVREGAGVLELEKSGKVLKIDAENGRVLSVESTESRTKIADLRKSAFPKPEDGGGFLYFEPGAYARFAKYLDRETKNFHAGHNPQRPISSSLEFLLGEAEPILLLAEKDYPIEVVTRLIQLDAIRPLDRLWIEWQADSTDENFRLPWSSEDSEDFRFFGLEKKLPLGLGKQIARVAYGLHGLVVPPESGPAQVGWNLALLCTGRAWEASQNLESLPRAPEAGPLTCWYASRLFGRLSKSAGKKFAAAGLQKLDLESFRREMDHLLPEESLLFELVGSLGIAVRQLDDDEFAQLSLLLGEQGKHPAVPKLIEKLRQEQGTPSRAFLLEAIGQLWNIRGQAYVRERLEKLVQASEPPKPATTADLKWLEGGKSDDDESKPTNEPEDLDEQVERILKQTGVERETRR